MLKKENKLFLLYRIFIFLLFMDSMYPWYMWNNNVTRITIAITSILSVYLFLSYRGYFTFDRKRVSLILFFTIALVYYFFIHPNITYFFIYPIWILLLALKNEHQRNVLYFITKWFAIILSISFLFYILFLFGISVSPSYLNYNKGQYEILNYYTFTIPFLRLGEYIRFKSIFMEPGHLTMGLVSLIFANGMNLKNRYVQILCIIELFTFSLAGYITLFIGFLLLNFTVKRLRILLSVVLLLIIVVSVLEKAGYSDMLDQFLWNRLEYDDGDIAGNNRVTREFEYVYNSQPC